MRAGKLTLFFFCGGDIWILQISALLVLHLGSNLRNKQQPVKRLGLKISVA